MHADATFPRLENKVWFENTKLNVWANEWILYHEINKEASSVLCSVVKHLGSGRALEEGKNTRLRLVFPPKLLSWSIWLPECFTTEQSTAEASLFSK